MELFEDVIVRMRALLPQTPDLLTAPDFSLLPFNTAAQRFLDCFAALTATA